MNRSSGDSSKKLALFRADGSLHLGMGHIMRCLGFAQGFEKVGVNSIFVIRDYEQEVTELIRCYEYGVEMIPRDWSFEEDASLTLKLAHLHDVNLIVTDLCNTDILKRLDEYGDYLQRLKDQAKFLITIDDLNVIPFPSDIVINPNCGAENMGYDFGQGTKFLLGPAYFIFREGFIESTRTNREIKGEARNILVSMGGSDPFNLTVKIARALTKIEVAPKLNLRIALGLSAPVSAKQEVGEILKNFAGNYELIQGSDNMAKLMLWSDLAITSDGLTKYETAVTGTPSIIIARFEHQSELMKEFEKKEAALNLGFGSKVDEKAIVEAVEKLLKDDALRKEMSKRGKKLVDGRGVERIISAIPQEVWA